VPSSITAGVKMVNSKKYVARIVLLLIMAVMLTLLLASLALAKRDARVYPSNITVSGVELGGLSRDQAGRVLADRLPADCGTQLLLQTPSRTLSIPINQVNIAYDIPATLAKIDVALQPEGIAGIFQHSIARGSTRNIAPEIKWNATLLQQRLSAVKLTYDQPAINARILYNNDYLDYIGHKNGYSIDIAASLDRICAVLEKGSLGPVPLVTSETYPRVRLEDIKEVKDILGIGMKKINQPTADFDPLLEICNGSVVIPGEEFSLPETIAARHLKVNNSALTVVNDVLYRTCSQAGLKPVGPRTSFINNLEHPVLITAVIEGSNFMVKIYGCQTEAGKEIKFITEKEELAPGVVMKVDQKLSPPQQIVLQEGKSGYIKRSYRVVKVNGQEIEKNLLAEEFTPGRDTIIAVGPGTIKK